jgi:chemotaxis protein CheY-P-specific phosphatase CheC
LHRDLLGEVFILGAGRAAASLAEFSGNDLEIELCVQRIDVLSLKEMAARITPEDEEDYCGISLEHTGELYGSSTLVYTP